MLAGKEDQTQVTVPADCEHVVPVAVAEPKVAPVGRGSVRLALVAGAAVRFCTLIEYVTVSMLTVTGSGESVKLLMRMSTCAKAAGANAARASTTHKRPSTETFISHPRKNGRR